MDPEENKLDSLEESEMPQYEDGEEEMLDTTNNGRYYAERNKPKENHTNTKKAKEDHTNTKKVIDKGAEMALNHYIPGVGGKIYNAAKKMPVVGKAIDRKQDKLAKMADKNPMVRNTTNLLNGNKKDESENKPSDNKDASDLSKKPAATPKPEDTSSKQNNENNKDNKSENKENKSLNPKDKLKSGAANKAQNLMGSDVNNLMAKFKKLKMVITILSNPVVLSIIGIVALLLLLIAMFTGGSGGSSGGGGLNAYAYYDPECNINSTSVSLNICSTDETKTLTLKDYVIGTTYNEIKDNDYSAGAIKALMIILKTNALAKGGYNNSNKSVSIDDCDMAHTNTSSVDDETLTNIKDYYNEIENYLYLSDSYTGTITNLGSESVLEINDNIKEKLKNTNSSDFEYILKELYPSQEGSTTTPSNNKPIIFIGDSRTVGLQASVGENTLNKDNVSIVASGGEGIGWLNNTGINEVNTIINNNGNTSYNIFSWLGVNGLHDSYASTYENLATTTWKNHTIYIINIGPVYDADTIYVKQNQIDDFNEKMENFIKQKNLSNLKYIKIDYSNLNLQYDAEGLHYNSQNYKDIYNRIMDAFRNNSSVSNTKALYNLGDNCTIYELDENNTAWWWPIGSAEPTDEERNIYGGTPVRLGNNSAYGTREINGKIETHNGEDIQGNRYDPVIATRSGTVLEARDGYGDGSLNERSYGNYILIDHGDGTKSKYAHLQKDTLTVKVGDHVLQGQKIAEVGTSGRSTGPHLHFEIIVNGGFVNPMDYISKENPRPIASSISTNDSDDSITKVCKILKNDSGLSDEAIAAIMGNLARETGINPNMSGNDVIAGSTGYGMAAWLDLKVCSDYSDVCSAAESGSCNGSKMKCFCKNKNLDWNTAECQTAYLINQIDTTYVNNRLYYKEILLNSFADYNSLSMYDNNIINAMTNKFCFRYEVAGDCYKNGEEIIYNPQRACFANYYYSFIKNDCSWNGIEDKEKDKCLY